MARDIDAEVTRAHRAQSLLGDLDALAEAEAKRATLSARVWKHSEVRRLLAHYRATDQNDKLLELSAELDEAKKAGRYFDDLEPTLANLRAQLGPDAWLYHGSNMPLLREWSNWADRTSPRKTRPTAAPGSQPDRFRTAVGTFNRWLLEGRLSNEIAFGVVYAAGAPEWFPARGMMPLESESPAGSVRFSRLVPRGDAEERPEFVAAQRDRWATFEDSARLVCELIFEGAKSLDDLPAFLPGFVWIPWPTGEAPAPGLVSFNAETRAAQRWLSNEARRVLEARRAAALAEIENSDAYRARLAAGADLDDATIRANAWGPKYGPKR